MVDMNTVNPRLDWFVKEIRKKMSTPKNMAKKGDWRDMTIWEISERIDDELVELYAELIKYHNGKSTPDDVIKECCDLAGFAMMMADKVRSGKTEGR